MRTPIADVDEAQWDALMNVNLKGVWLCMKHEIPAMLSQGGGAVVNVASIYGFKPSEIGHTPYVVSKFGVVGLTDPQPSITARWVCGSMQSRPASRNRKW